METALHNLQVSVFWAGADCGLVPAVANLCFPGTTSI